MHWDLTYFLINVFTLAGPLARSFEPRIAFYRRWWALFPAMAVTGALFIAWDVYFTTHGVWSFNDRYLIGWRLFGLPLEEWAFFITVPYACIFMYDCMNYFWPRTWFDNSARAMAALLSAIAAAIALLHTDHLYTVFTFSLSALCMGCAAWSNPAYLGPFFRGYIVALVPFLIVNGVLTGSFIEEQVVWYNDAENLGIRLGTIPLDDTMYLLPLFWMVVAGYETLLRRAQSPRFGIATHESN